MTLCAFYHSIHDAHMSNYYIRSRPHKRPPGTTNQTKRTTHKPISSTKTKLTAYLGTSASTIINKT